MINLLATGILLKAPTNPPDVNQEGLLCAVVVGICNMDRRKDETST